MKDLAPLPSAERLEIHEQAILMLEQTKAGRELLGRVIN